MAQRSDDRRKQILWLSVALLAIDGAGCGESSLPSTPPTVLPASGESSVPKGKAIADPLLRQARDAADALLLGLLQGQFDQDESLSVVAEKLRGYTSWSITSQTTTGQRTAEFKAMVSNAVGKATFRMTLVKHASGQWAISKFIGPTPQGDPGW
jgi:hypothetical protein